MKTLALALLLVSGGAAAELAVAPQDVVSAAKDAKAKRKKSTTKVLTNADVKKSKGVIGTTTAPTTPVVPEPTLMERHVAEKAARAAAAEKLAAAEIAVADLEAELAAIEQSYYEENDLTRRDTVLVKRFQDVKAKLDAARKERDQWSGGLEPAAADGEPKPTAPPPEP